MQNSFVTTPRKIGSRKKQDADETQGGGGSNCTKGSMSSQKGGALSSGRRSHRQGSDLSAKSRKSSRHDQLRELVGEIVTNMGYDGIPIVRIKGNKYLIGTDIQYLQQTGSLVVVLDKATGQELAPLSQFLAENIVKEVQAIEKHMNFHDKSLLETIEMLVAGHQASRDVINSVKRQVS